MRRLVHNKWTFLRLSFLAENDGFTQPYRARILGVDPRILKKVCLGTGASAYGFAFGYIDVLALLMKKT
jgi:hypothetical protein